MRQWEEAETGRMERQAEEARMRREAAEQAKDASSARASRCVFLTPVLRSVPLLLRWPLRHFIPCHCHSYSHSPTFLDENRRLRRPPSSASSLSRLAMLGTPSSALNRFGLACARRTEYMASASQEMPALSYKDIFFSRRPFFLLRSYKTLKTFHCRVTPS